MGVLRKKTGVPPTATLDQIAQAIIQLFQYIAQAGNAYSAMLILPGFKGIIFNPLQIPYKDQH
jgi:hypothetical protein